MLEEKTNALHADLEYSTLVCDHVLDGKLATEFEVHVGTPTSRSSLLHGVFYTVIKILAL